MAIRWRLSLNQDMFLAAERIPPDPLGGALPSPLPEAPATMDDATFIPIGEFQPGGVRQTFPREPEPRPPWIKVTVQRNEAFQKLEATARKHGLHTVCEEAACPNIFECWSRGTATFMLMGDVCSRHCGFCNVKSGALLALDPDEPEGVADSVDKMGIRHAVITSVNRDDLPDGGSAHIARTIRAVKERCPETTVEILAPDFCGDEAALDRVLEARPDVFAHNLESIERLYRRVRPEADYAQSLRVLRHAADRRDREGIIRRVKSGIMVGLGEKFEEVQETLSHLRTSGVDVVTIGQYLKPTPRHLPVERFVRPEEFEQMRVHAESLGIPFVESGPLVRSSYRAERAVEALEGTASSGDSRSPQDGPERT